MKKFLIFSLKSLIVFCALFLAAIIIIYSYFEKDLPDYHQLANYKPPITTRLYARTGQVFAEYAWEKRLYVPIESIPPKVIQAFLSAEDKNFYTHLGIDIPSIISAILMNVSRVAQSKRPIGASTITQQVARNFLLTDTAHAVSYERKFKEAILAFRIEKAYSKNYILELFLNEIYLGSGAYGVAAAALTYFNKSLDELTLSEIAYLAALPKAPSRYHPLQHAKAALNRRNYVIRRLLEDHYIKENEAKDAIAQPLQLQERHHKDIVSGSYFAEEVRRELIDKYGEKVLYQEGLVVRTCLDPYLQDEARKALQTGLIAYDQAHGWRGPLAHFDLANQKLSLTDLSNHEKSKQNWQKNLELIHWKSELETWKLAIVLDVKDQKAIIGCAEGSIGEILLKQLKWAQKSIKAQKLGSVITKVQDVLMIGDVIIVEQIPEKTDKKSLKSYKLCQTPEVSGSMVVMDPHTGRVFAIQGGFDFQTSQFNRVTQAYRQMGSTFKPFIFLTALEAGLTPASLLYDGRFSLDLGKGLGIWTPHNYDKDKYEGSITLRHALEISSNLAPLWMVYDYLGMEKIKETAERLGLVKTMPLHFSAILGASETTLLKLATAYAIIANGGKKITPTLFDRIQDRHGRNLYINSAQTCENCQTNFWKNILPKLKDQRPQIIDRAISYQIISMLQGSVERGTAKGLKDIKQPLAAKTGTSSNFQDAWIVVFTPDLVVAVHVGYDQPRCLGEHQSGGRLALPIARNFLNQVLKNTSVKPFNIPAGIRHVRINANTGSSDIHSSSNIILEVFKTESWSSLTTPQFPVRFSSDQILSPSTENQFNESKSILELENSSQESSGLY